MLQVNEVADYMEKVGETANRSDYNLSKLQLFLEKNKLKQRVSIKPNNSFYSNDTKSAGHSVPR